MNIIAVIVTYSDRFHLLKQVIDACIASDINEIVVVDNNSDKSSKEQLKQFLNKLNSKITVIWNSSNLGSAKAYKQGLEKAKNSNCDYIWLLDDDNKPQKNALKELIDFWKKKPDKVKTLLSYRPDRVQYKQAVFEKNSKLVLSSKNSFSGFHIKEKIVNLFTISNSVIDNSLKYGQIEYAPYGGMFFEKSLLNEIGYPNEEFFLYSDDHDWSYRITMKGMEIYLVLDSVIDDIDTSWALKEKKSSVFKKLKNAPPFRIYYAYRNRILFEKKYLVSSNFVYNFNKFIFTFILFFYSFNSKNFKVYLKALKDARTNNLVKF